MADEYNPRADCSDVDLDSDDRWFTLRGVLARVDEIVQAHEATTVGIAETPLTISPAEARARLQSWEGPLRQVGRIQDRDRLTLYHWTVAELIAHEALFQWWQVIADWPLGEWPRPQ